MKTYNLIKTQGKILGGKEMKNKGLKRIEEQMSKLKQVLAVKDISLIWPLKGIFYQGIPKMGRISSILALNTKRILNITRYKNNNIAGFSKDPIFLSELMCFKDMYDIQGLVKIFDNEYNYNIIKKLNIAPVEILDYDFFNIFDMVKIKQILAPKRIPVEKFIGCKLIRIERDLSKDIIKSLKQSFNAVDIVVEPYIITKAIPEVIRWYLTWENILTTFKNAPFLFLINEYSPFPYFGVVWAKKLGVPSIALQHGVIYPTHPGYFHFPENVAKDPDDYINHVIPTLTLVQGKYEQRLLLKMGYPKKAIRITGQPRYDFLKYSNEIFKKEEIIERYSLPRNKKFLLWTTQTHGLSKEENIKNIIEISKAMKKLRDKYHLIIKLHPGENQRAPLYRKYLKGKDYFTIIGGTANTYELIYISEALITKHSTTGIEAIAMNKPILLTEFVKSHDLSLYTDYGFNYILRSSQDLVDYVRKIEKGDLIQDFQRKRKRFMKDRLSNFGNATEKIVKILERFL